MEISPRLDPQLAPLLDQMPDSIALTRENIPLMRERSFVLPLEIGDRVERTDHLVPGAPPVPVRVHRPKERTEEILPAVVSIHGGGYIVGSYADDDLRHDRWTNRYGYVGVAVEYRLAPETPFPGPLEDCYAALKWTYDNAAELGVDPDRIGISGDSAGGGLAAALGLLARDRGEVPLAFQQLIYPMIDDRRTSITSQWDVPIWAPASNELGWSCYLGDLFGTDDIPYIAAAARCDDLSGLPPTFVCTGALDLFCDEDIDYAQRLNQAGVDVELHVYPGAPHGFDMFGKLTEISRRAVRDQSEWLARQLR
jgi:acetyl esterase/lipase